MMKPLLPPVCERSFEYLIKLAYDELEDYVGKRGSNPTINDKIREKIRVEDGVQVQSIRQIEIYVDKTIPKLTKEQFEKVVKRIIPKDKRKKRIPGILSKWVNDDAEFGFGLYPSRKKTTVYLEWLGAHAYEESKVIGIAKRLIQLPLKHTEHEDLREKAILNLRRYETSKVREKRYRDFLKFQEGLEEIALPNFQEMHAKELLERANVLNRFNDLQSLVLERRTREITETKLEMGINYRASILRKMRNEKLGYPPDEAREIVRRTMYFESGFKPFVGLYMDVSSSVYRYGLLPLLRKISLAADYVFTKFKDDVDHVIIPFDGDVGMPLDGAKEIIRLGTGYGTNTGGAIDDGIRRKVSTILLLTDGQTYFDGCYRKHHCSPKEYAYRKAKEAKENNIRLVAVCVHIDPGRRYEGDEMFDYLCTGHKLPLDSNLRRFVDNLARLSEGVAFHLTPTSFEVGCTKAIYDVLEASLKPRIESLSSVIYDSL